MPSKVITCPSGLQGEIRNFKAKELSILADPANRHAIRAGKKKGQAKHPLDPVYDNVWLETRDAGPYEVGKDGKPTWSKVLICDRFFMLLHVRDLTWGTYEFKVKCPVTSCPRHKKGFLWDLDLNQLEFKEMPKESRDRVKANDLVFDLEIAGKKCKFKLLTGDDEINAPTMSDDMPSHKKLLAQVATRLYYVEGIDDDEERVDWVGELDAPDLYAISKQMDAVDGGVETRTKVVCDDCSEEFTIDVPFGDAGFLAPTPS